MSAGDDDGDFLVWKFFKCRVFVHFRCRPLPHFRTRPHWKPPGNPEYARNTLRFPRDEESCKMGKFEDDVGGDDDDHDDNDDYYY